MLKKFIQKDPKNLISAFIGGSLFVMITCLGLTAFVFSISFIGKERERVNIAKQQIVRTFNFFEEMLSTDLQLKNFESVAKLVSTIAQQVGVLNFDLYISDKNGECIFQSGHAVISPMDPCFIPSMVAKMGSTTTLPALYYHEAYDTNVYIMPIYEGLSSDGYLYVVLDDPFLFFQGNALSFSTSTLLPSIIAILVIWGLWLTVSHRYLLEPYLEKMMLLQKQEIVARTARQVAHDLRSPIATLLSVTAGLKQIPDDKMKLVRGAVSTIRDIAQILTDRKTQVPEKRSILYPSVHLLSSLMDSVVAERREQYRRIKPVFIECPLNEASYGLFVKVEPLEFKRLLSNLINNAVEAIDGSGDVSITAYAEGGFVMVKVNDNGRGIHPNRLPQLGEYGATFDKEDGSGLGLFHAKESVARWGGDIIIESKVGFGTTVTIKLPQQKSPDWFASEIFLKRNSHVFVLDDEESIHDIWRDRLTHFPVQVHCFSNTADFLTWTQDFQRDSKSVLSLCDYNLRNPNISGLDFIVELGLEKSAVVVTGSFSDEEIQQRCIEKNVKLMPKEMITAVPIRS